MSVYLEKFILPEKENDLLLGGCVSDIIENIYPFRIFADETDSFLSEVDFDKITIFYGGNGSGKSTLCNLIAQKLDLIRIAPFSTGELFNKYLYNCDYRMAFDEYGYKYRVPNGSRIITSDEVFDYLIASRLYNEYVAEKTNELNARYDELVGGKTFKFNGLDDYEDLKLQCLARKKSLSRHAFLKKVAGEEVAQGSNGETALCFFEKKLLDNTLYILDEPENSLSPIFQLKLKDILQDLAKNCGCQFIIATHSPFLLSLDNAKIYNLDAKPVTINKWYELENCKVYYDFFKKNEQYFLD